MAKDFWKFSNLWVLSGTKFWSEYFFDMEYIWAILLNLNHIYKIERWFISVWRKFTIFKFFNFAIFAEFWPTWKMVQKGSTLRGCTMANFRVMTQLQLWAKLFFRKIITSSTIPKKLKNTSFELKVTKKRVFYWGHISSNF